MLFLNVVCLMGK